MVLNMFHELCNSSTSAAAEVALVSQMFHEVATKPVYHMFIINSSMQWQRFHRTIYGDRHLKRLATYVRYFALLSQDIPGLRDQRGFYKDLQDILPNLTNIYTIVLDLTTPTRRHSPNSPLFYVYL